MSYNPSTPTSSSSAFTSNHASYPVRTTPGLGTPKAGPSKQAEPITRSRTLFYLSVRDSSSTSFSRSRRRGRVQYGDTIDVADEDEEREGLMGESSGGRRGSAAVDMGGLPPKWVDVSDEVEEILGKISPKIATLDKLHAKHVLPGFTDRTAEEREIERQTADITRVRFLLLSGRRAERKDFRRCTNLISSIAPTRGAQRVEIMTAKNVQRGLASKVQEMSAVFRKKQRVYMQKLQGHAIKNKDLLAASGAITLRGPESFDELQEDEQAVRVSVYGGSLSKEQSKSELQSQSQVAVDLDIETRTKEITQIASSISELADLFRDLGNLVVEQGTVLDSVEYNVQTTARELKGAVEELKTAQRYQANTGRRRCILLLVLVIVGLIVVLIYKPRGHPPPPAPPPSTPPVEALEGVTIAAPTYGHKPTDAVNPSVPRPPPPPIPIGDDEE